MCFLLPKVAKKESPFFCRERNMGYNETHYLRRIMFIKTYTIDAIKGEERVTEKITGNYFQMSSRVTAIRNHGFVIQSVIKN